MHLPSKRAPSKGPGPTASGCRSSNSPERKALSDSDGRPLFPSAPAGPVDRTHCRQRGRTLGVAPQPAWLHFLFAASKWDLWRRWSVVLGRQGTRPSSTGDLRQTRLARPSRISDTFARPPRSRPVLWGGLYVAFGPRHTSTFALSKRLHTRLESCSDIIQAPWGAPQAAIQRPAPKIWLSQVPVRLAIDWSSSVLLSGSFQSSTSYIFAPSKLANATYSLADGCRMENF